MDHYTPHLEYRQQRLLREADVRRLIAPSGQISAVRGGRSRRLVRRSHAVLAALIALSVLGTGAVVSLAVEGSGEPARGSTAAAWYVR